jgi:hypothetical protein
MAGVRPASSGTRFYRRKQHKRKKRRIRAHLRGTSLDHHEPSFADATGLHRDSRRRTSVGGLEFLNIIVVGHCWTRGSQREHRDARSRTRVWQKFFDS